jgi:ribonuclease VapC
VIVDASALIALIHREPGWERLVEALDAAPYAAVAAPTLAEAMIVLSARDVAPTVLPALLAAADVEVLSFGPDHAYEAAAAFRRFGTGRPSAALNFGDCMAYAAAQVADAPLLFVGEDFAQTDVRAALS